MANAELFPLSGTVVRKLQTQWSEKNGKKFSRTVFILKPYTGGKDLFVTKFGVFDANLITKDIKFNATKFNETSYTVQGDIEVVEEAAIPEAPSATKEEVVEEKPQGKRGRPKKTEEVKVAQEAPVASGVQSSDVLGIVTGNITDAQRVIEQLGLKDVNLLDLADMIGRTRVALRIEAGKDQRMASFRR